MPDSDRDRTTSGLLSELAMLTEQTSKDGQARIHQRRADLVRALRANGVSVEAQAAALGVHFTILHRLLRNYPAAA